MTLDITIINAVLTLAAVVIALYVALRETYLHRKELRLHQAGLIAVWLLDVFQSDRGLFYNVAVSNQSSQPIFDAVLSIGVVHGAGSSYYKGDDNNTCIIVVPPGLYIAKVPYAGGGMNMVFNASISFRDIRNHAWRRDANGYLKETKKDPLAELEITLPASWDTIEPFPLK